MSKLIPLFVTASGLSEWDVRSIISNAPSRYKRYPIAKRTGGDRIISQPAREVKFFQRVLMREILSSLPVHPAATAYCAGKSIYDNAVAHVDSGAIIKFDFQDFFPSIVSDDWRTYCLRNSIFDSEEDIRISSNILFSKTKYGSILRLAVGAPSSPMLSNILMIEFDNTISNYVEKDKVTYTRYADDLTFSAKRAGNLSDVEKTLRKALKKMKSPSLTLNEKKTKLVTKRYRRVITGLVVSDQKKVSLGRDKKREISAMVHHYATGKLSPDKFASLGGYLAHANSVDPEFVSMLNRKYGDSVLISLRTGTGII